MNGKRSAARLKAPLAFALALLMLLSMAACGEEKTNEVKVTTEATLQVTDENPLSVIPDV